MIKTCKCNNILSDAVVPNKVVYWTYFEEEWQVKVQRIKGQRVFPVVRTVWHCSKCDRLYNWEPRDNKLYTYLIDNKATDDIMCTCVNELQLGKLLKVYSYNDFEADSIYLQVKEGVEVMFPREIYFCPKCKRIYIRKDNKFKIYNVEEAIDLIK